MYREFFGFEEMPFSVTPDTRYLYPSPLHQSVLSTLQYGIGERRGFLLLTGEVGTGKTVTLKTLLNEIQNPSEQCGREGEAPTALPLEGATPPPSFEGGGATRAPIIETSLILHPQLSRLELLKTINRDFGQAIKKNSFPAQMEALNHFVLRAAKQGKNCLLVIDEAQQLPEESLEMTRLLSNLETDTHKLLQILLVGQPELEEKLGNPELRQLRQRIQIHCKLEPLDLEETSKYICFRIQKAGEKPRASFEESAVARIHRLSRGIPRLINTICDYSLMSAYLKNHLIVTKKMVDQAFLESEGSIPYVTHS